MISKTLRIPKIQKCDPYVRCLAEDGRMRKRKLGWKQHEGSFAETLQSKVAISIFFVLLNNAFIKSILNPLHSFKSNSFNPFAN